MPDLLPKGLFRLDNYWPFSVVLRMDADTKWHLKVLIHTPNRIIRLKGVVLTNIVVGKKS